MPAKPKTIDDYLAGVSAEQLAALEKIRKTIQSAAPDAEECISYGLAAFRLNGKALVAFGATANHCAFFPMSGNTVADFKDELKNYDTSKGTIRFPASKPPPAALVKKLVKARIAESAGLAPAEGSAPAKPTTKKRPASSGGVQAAIAELKRLATKKTRDGMARYGLPSDKAFGVTVADLQKLAKRLGRDHALAAELWDTGWYEARLLAALVDEPERVTPAQMDRWCRDFDSWGIVDTVCFVLFDRTPHAWAKVEAWSDRSEEFVKRAAFALLRALTVHDKKAGDEPFLKALPLIELAAVDEWHYVKKAVNMALRATGKRNPTLHAAAVRVAERLAASPEAAPRWVGKDALRELTSPKLRVRGVSPTRKRGGQP